MFWKILAACIGLFVFYMLCRIAAYAIAKSWFQVKHYEERKEIEDGKGQEKEIERRPT